MQGVFWPPKALQSLLQQRPSPGNMRGVLHHQPLMPYLKLLQLNIPLRCTLILTPYSNWWARPAVTRTFIKFKSQKGSHQVLLASIYISSFSLITTIASTKAFTLHNDYIGTKRGVGKGVGTYIGSRHKKKKNIPTCAHRHTQAHTQPSTHRHIHSCKHIHSIHIWMHACRARMTLHAHKINS